jgi:hypothetical protein
LLWHNSAFYNNVFEALNLLLINFYTFVAEIQLPGNGISLLSSVRCFKEIWKLGKVGKVGKVGEVGEVGKVGRKGLFMPTWSQL